MKTLSAFAVALTLLGSSGALAQYNGGPSYGTDNRYQDRSDQNRDLNTYQPQQRNDYQLGRDQSDNQGANRYQSQEGARGRNEVRDNPHWSRGDRLPSEYRNNRYVVSDWKNNHLRKPPRGYHWVQADDRYVLATVASGIIADIIMASNQNNQRRR